MNVRPTVLSQHDLQKLVASANMRRISLETGLAYNTVRKVSIGGGITADTAELLSRYFMQRAIIVSQ